MQPSALWKLPTPDAYANQAGAGVRSAYDGAVGAATRGMTRMGVNPNSGRFAGTRAMLARDEAADVSAARQTGHMRGQEANAQYGLQRDAAIRQWAQFALRKRDQNFQHDAQRKRFDLAKASHGLEMERGQFDLGRARMAAGRQDEAWNWRQQDRAWETGVPTGQGDARAFSNAGVTSRAKRIANRDAQTAALAEARQSGASRGIPPLGGTRGEDRAWVAKSRRWAESDRAWNDTKRGWEAEDRDFWVGSDTSPVAEEQTDARQSGMPLPDYRGERGRQMRMRDEDRAWSVGKRAWEVEDRAWRVGRRAWEEEDRDWNVGKRAWEAEDRAEHRRLLGKQEEVGDSERARRNDAYAMGMAMETARLDRYIRMPRPGEHLPNGDTRVSLYEGELKKVQTANPSWSKPRAMMQAAENAGIDMSGYADGQKGQSSAGQATPSRSPLRGSNDAVKGQEGYWTTGAINLGYARDGIYDAKGDLTPMGSQFLDVVNALKQRAPEDVTEADIAREAAKRVGLYTQKQMEYIGPVEKLGKELEGLDSKKDKRRIKEIYRDIQVLGNRLLTDLPRGEWQAFLKEQKDAAVGDKKRLKELDQIGETMRRRDFQTDFRGVKDAWRDLREGNKRQGTLTLAETGIAPDPVLDAAWEDATVEHRAEMLYAVMNGDRTVADLIAARKRQLRDLAWRKRQRQRQIPGKDTGVYNPNGLYDPTPAVNRATRILRDRNSGR